jgi:acetyltransferase-like isoleucine patch superfamily enzyme
MKKLEKLYAKFEQKWAYTSKKRYIAYLRRKGIVIGENLWITNDFKSIFIDVTRPSLIEIGSDVRLNKNLTILSHDGSYYVLRTKYKEFIPTSGKVKIGNNVYFGRNCSVFKGVTIGDNCIIGFGSVVTKDIPENSVAVGAPAKVLCTLDEYYEKRKRLCVEEAFVYARSIKERFNRRPVIEDFWEEFPLFLDGNEECSRLPIKEQLRGAYSDYKKNHKAMFNGFEDFLKNAGL